MSFASVEIEITDTPIAGENVSISLNAQTPYITETAQIVRASPAQFTLDADLITSSSNLVSALNADYTVGGLVASYPISPIDLAAEILYIDATEYGVTFAIINEPSWASITITPEIVPSVLEIDTITPTEADGVDKCGTARYDFTVNNATFPIDILTPVIKTANNAGELFFDYERYPVPQVTLSIEDALAATDSILLPRVTTYSFDSVTVTEAFSSATVVLNYSIINLGDTSPSLEYSINNIDWFSSNVFYGLLPGSFTAYMRDSFGCIHTLPFEVVGVDVDKPLPSFNIENANGLKFFESPSSFNYITTFPFLDNANINNQPYFNTEERCYKQRVLKSEPVTTQIKTPYETITVNVRDLITDEIVLNPIATEKVTNILLKDKRDCKIKEGASGKTNIYFPSGNIYTPDTTDVIQTYSNPNLLLPEFLDSGTLDSGVLVTLSNNAILNGDFSVEDDVYDTEINGKCLQINGVYTGLSSGTDAHVQSLYNALDYNIWEFTINFNSLDEGNYYIEVIGTDDDPRYDTITWLSEPINSSDTQYEDTTLIEWYNTSNYAQMDYSTGIINKMRIPARFMLYTANGEKESFKTDSGKIIPLKKIIARDITLETDLIPQYINEKIDIATGHDVIKINGLEVAQEENGESEGLLAEQNRMYKYTGIFRLSDTTTIGNESGIVSDSGEVLGADSGSVIGI